MDMRANLLVAHHVPSNSLECTLVRCGICCSQGGIFEANWQASRQLQGLSSPSQMGARISAYGMQACRPSRRRRLLPPPQFMNDHCMLRASPWTLQALPWKLHALPCELQALPWRPLLCLLVSSELLLPARGMCSQACARMPTRAYVHDSVRPK